MGERSLSRRVVVGALTCVLLLLAYGAGAFLSRTPSSSSEFETEIGHVVTGDPLAGLDLDASLYGTETPEEQKAIEDCYESAVGVRKPGELATPTYDELYAWRECAVDLGIESKVMMTEAVSDDELKRQADEANAQMREQVECLEELGWKVVRIPAGNDGFESFEVDAQHDSKTEDRVTADVASCGGHAGESHDH